MRWKHLRFIFYHAVGKSKNEDGMLCSEGFFLVYDKTHWRVLKSCGRWKCQHPYCRFSISVWSPYPNFWSLILLVFSIWMACCLPTVFLSALWELCLGNRHICQGSARPMPWCCVILNTFLKLKLVFITCGHYLLIHNFKTFGELWVSEKVRNARKSFLPHKVFSP